MMKRRVFLGSALSAAAMGSQRTEAASNATQKMAVEPSEPLVWPVATKRQPDVPSFAGHTDTVPDIVGRIGTPPSLVILTEGNQLMVLLSEEIVGSFPSWAKSQAQYADINTDNIVVVTLPRANLVQMVRSGGIKFGNLTLDVSRASGFYPDAVIGGPTPLRGLRKLGVLEPEARFCSQNRGPALLVRKGNPFGIKSLDDVARTGARLAQAASVEAGARAGNRAVIEAILGTVGADAFFAREVEHFSGRLGIAHRDIPEMLARGYADVGLTYYQLISYWARTFPNHFELITIDAERFSTKTAFGRVVDPLRSRTLKAFESFFFSRAKDVYPQYDFARMSDDEFGAELALDSDEGGAH